MVSRPRRVEHAGEHAAVGLDGGPVDVVGLPGAEEHAGRAHLVRGAGPAEGDVPEVLAALGVVGREDERLEVVGHRRPEGQAVDANPRSPPLGE